MNETDINIREETLDDHSAIAELTVQAFTHLGMGEVTEHLMVERLREAGALSVSLVAELAGRVVGHIAFSPVTLSSGVSGWYCLGPVSVLPELHRRGIGGLLIRKGLEELKASGSAGCCLVGHPEYYGRFGFIHPEGMFYEGVDPQVFFALSFSGEYPPGSVAFHSAFGSWE
jgi:putative acetyltransferase